MLKIAEKVFSVTIEFDEDNCKEEEYFVGKIKENFQKTTSKDTKLVLLSLLSREWGVDKIIEEFPGSTSYMIKKSRKL